MNINFCLVPNELIVSLINKPGLDIFICFVDCFFRFEKRIYIPLPDASARLIMFNLHIGQTPHCIPPEKFKQLAQNSEGYGLDLI